MGYTLRMHIVGYLLVVILLSGLALAIYVLAPKAPELSVVQTATSTTSGTEMKVEDIYGDTDTYHIEMHYPQFGIPSVDAKIKSVVDTAVDTFKEYPANPPDSSLPQNELTGSFASTYVGPDVVSVKLSLSEYTGGAHPNTVLIGINVDPRSGRELTLDDALSMIGKDLQQVADESLKELRSKLGDNVLDSAKGAEAKSENYSTFVVSKDKVTFIFNVYQVAPYAAGPQEVSFARVR